MIYTLVIFPVQRAAAWEWIAGSASPGLSSDGASPATHKWFSIHSTATEDERINATLTSDDTRLAVDTNIDSPVAVIEAATGLKPLQQTNP